MKAILEFNLPEDAEEHLDAINGTSYKLALSEMDNHFRHRLKYEEHPREVIEALQKARDCLRIFTEGLPL
jgi:hypothetical protein